MNEGQEHVQALRLPSARAFVQTVEQELRAGRFVWVLAPSVDLVSTLNVALTERFWYDAVGQVSLGAIDAVHPWRGIAEALRSAAPDRRLGLRQEREKCFEVRVDELPG